MKQEDSRSRQTQFAPHGAPTMLTALTTYKAITQPTACSMFCFCWDMVPYVTCLKCWWQARIKTVWNSTPISCYILQIDWPQWENCLYLFLLCHLQVTILKVRAGSYLEKRHYSLHRSVFSSQIQKSPITAEEPIKKLKKLRVTNLFYKLHSSSSPRIWGQQTSK